MKIVQIDYHRNGISGEGFYAVLFDCLQGGRMLASVFDEPGYVSVISIDRLNEHGVASFHNAWRGDFYEAELRKAIREHVEAQRAQLSQEHS